MPPGKIRAANSVAVERYTHPEASCPTRPEAGTQAQFRAGNDRQTYRDDSSLSPALDWEVQNAARDR